MVSNQKPDVISMSGPGFMTRQIFAYLMNNSLPGLLIAPKHFFYPVSNDDRDKLSPATYRSMITGDESYSCHMWESTWQKS